MSRILVVDDDQHILRTLEILLKDDGHVVITAIDAEQALQKLEKESVEIALIDLQLPGMSGTDLLRILRDKHREVESVIITAHGTIDSAVEAIKEGAFDYLTKPFSPEIVRHRVSQIERVKMLNGEVSGLRQRVGELPFGAEFLSQNSKVLHLLEVARDVARSEATILISGESGVGKTLLAKLIHQSGERNQGPFVTVDCTLFQEQLLESELFGHKKGSFTGAIADKTGKVETADGGTIFLDEIGELPLGLQSKLLRLVDEKRYERVGDPKLRSVDARIIAATNRNLEEMLADKSFREDLYYRLSVVDLYIPPLRNRPEDILLQAQRFLAGFANAHEKAIEDWESDFEKSLLAYSWPGNTRELGHAIERAVLMAPGRRLRQEHLPIRIIEHHQEQLGIDAMMSLAELEETHIKRALALNLSQEETASILGIDPSTLWRKRKKYGV